MVGQNQQDNGPEGDNTRAQACNDANTHTNASRQFTRIVQRKNLPCEKDSIAKVAYDPAHIPDCNVQATVGQHFLFHEPNPKRGEWKWVPPSNQEVIVMAARTISQHMDVSEGLITHHVHGKRLPMDSKQHYVEPPSNDVASTAPRFIEADT